MSSSVSRPSDPGRSLTTREAALVEIITRAASEGRDITREEAGRLAGYGGSDESARVQASRALSRPAVRNALVERIRELAQADVPFAYGVIRHVAAKAGSTRDKLGAASKLLDVAGVTGGNGQATGAGVAIQIVFRTDAGALLVQSEQARPERQAIPATAGVIHSLAEGEGERKAPARQAKRAPTPGQAQAAEAPRGVENRARKSPAGSPARRAPRKSSGKSGGSDG